MENLMKRQTKRAPMKKRQIKPVPNAIPNLEQRYRIFKEIDYPYMMRNVDVQKNEEDRLIEAIQKAFEIPSKTPEEIADKALLQAQYSGKSYPIYTDEDVFNMKSRYYLEPLFDDYDDEVFIGGKPFDSVSETPYDVFFRSEPVEVPTKVDKEDPRIASLLNKIDTLSFAPSPARTNLIDYGTETSKPYTRRGRPPKNVEGTQAKSAKSAKSEKSEKPSKEAKNIGDIIGKYVRAKQPRNEYIQKKKTADLTKELFERNIQQLKEDERQRKTQLLSLTGSPSRIQAKFSVYDAMRNSLASERQSLLFDVGP